MTEEHGGGKQLVRIRARPAIPLTTVLLWCALGAFIWISTLAQLPIAYSLIASAALLLLSGRAAYEAAAASAAMEYVIKGAEGMPEPHPQPAPQPSADAQHVPRRRLDPRVEQRGEQIADEVLDLNGTWVGSEGST